MCCRGSAPPPPQGPYLACMTAVLKQMDDSHYAHYISTFKTRQDIIVSPASPQTPRQ